MIRDDIWNMLNMQHITPYSKRWDYSDIPGRGIWKGPAHMTEGDHHRRKRTQPAPTYWPQNTLRTRMAEDKNQSRGLSNITFHCISRLCFTVCRFNIFIYDSCAASSQYSVTEVCIENWSWSKCNVPNTNLLSYPLSRSVGETRYKAGRNVTNIHFHLFYSWTVLWTAIYIMLIAIIRALYDSEYKSALHRRPDVRLVHCSGHWATIPLHNKSEWLKVLSLCDQKNCRVDIRDYRCSWEQWTLYEYDESFPYAEFAIILQK